MYRAFSFLGSRLMELIGLPHRAILLAAGLVRGR